MEVPTLQQHNKLAARLEEALELLAYAVATAGQWVPPATAAVITQRDEKTLRTERDRPDTLIKYRGEGRKIEYYVPSLRDYNLRRGVSLATTAQRVSA